jgi:3-dehydroquinate synthase
LGKNMIGAFHQPQGVVIDIDTLNTLEVRQLRAGLAEVIKYGLIGDLEFFEWLELHALKLLAREEEALTFAIARSCQNKADIVAEDERESGRRALLNLGHTFGHAIETGMGYEEYLHGEAVAIGMVLAAKMSARLGWLPKKEVERISTLIGQVGLPIQVPKALTPTTMLNLMQVDKKVREGKIRLVLLSKIGCATVTDDYEFDKLMQILQEG